MRNKNQYWKDYAYVIRGKQRLTVLKVINKPMTVTEIKKATGLSLSEASIVIRGFAERKLAQCLNPKDALGRVYELTKEGKEIQKEVNLSTQTK